jgi:hypothetical protein
MAKTNSSGMVTILGYDSLLHADLLRRTLPSINGDALRPVRVYGFRRLFNLIITRLVDCDRGLDGQTLLRSYVAPAELQRRL